MVDSYEIIANGTQNTFSLPFMVYRFEDIHVYVDNQLQNQGYNLTNLANAEGAKLIFANNLGHPNKAVTLRVERLSRVSPWVRFYDHKPLKAEILNANMEHSYAIMTDHRRLHKKWGNMDEKIKNTQEILEQSQSLNAEALSAKTQAETAMVNAQNAAKKAEDISNLEARAVKFSSAAFGGSVTHVAQGLEALANKDKNLNDNLNSFKLSTGNTIAPMERDITELKTKNKNLNDNLNHLKNATESSIMPIGSLLIWFFNNPPQGFLQAKGQLVKRSDYAELWSLVQKNGGALSESSWQNQKGRFSYGDGQTTFRLPDLRDMFLRGISSNRKIGSYQSDSFASHSHRGPSGRRGLLRDGTSLNQWVALLEHGSYTNGTATGLDVVAATGGSETRPKNIGLNFCIKVKNYF